MLLSNIRHGATRHTYKAPLDFESALREIEANARKQVDPNFAEAFSILMKENRKRVSRTENR